MIDFFKKLFSGEESYIGALFFDEEDQESGVKFEEIVTTANKADWKPLDINKYNYPIRNQATSYSCRAATLALMSSILYFLRTNIWVDFSFMWIYSQRRNKPSKGMFASDGISVGNIPDVLMPSDNKTELQMNNAQISPWLSDIAKVFEIGTPIILPKRDIDLVASVIQTTGKPVSIIVSFGPGEWTKVPKVLSDNAPSFHFITVLDYGMYEGEKSLLIQDSWGKDLTTISGKRIIKESFFNKRNWYVEYFMRFKFDKVDKPSYSGTIVSAQDCFKYEGLFPTNVNSTGVVGNITKEATTKFQQKYGIKPVTGIIGPITNSKLKELFP